MRMKFKKKKLVSTLARIPLYHAPFRAWYSTWLQYWLQMKLKLEQKLHKQERVGRVSAVGIATRNELDGPRI